MMRSLRKNLITGASMAAVTLATLACGSSAASGDLLPVADVKDRLSELRALKKVPQDSRTLSSHSGPKSAYITIHKFADFRCGHCLNTSTILNEAKGRWPGRIRVYYRYFPLDSSCNRLLKQGDGQACRAAQAAHCSTEQNIFAGMYRGLFALQTSRTDVTDATVKNLTEKLGGDFNKLKACMTSRATSIAINRDINDAETLNMKSVPLVMVNDYIASEGTPYREWFLQTLDALVFEKEGETAYKEYKERMGKK